MHNAVIRFVGFCCGTWLILALDDPLMEPTVPGAFGAACALAAPYVFDTLRRMVLHR
jgi:hypothetical protein